MPGQRKTLNLAPQGGGALGALTWGVLDRLLEEPRLRIEKSFNANLAFLLKLKEEGRQRAQTWLEQSAGLLGRRSSIDLNAFL